MGGARITNFLRRRVIYPFRRQVRPEARVTVGGEQLEIDLRDPVIARLLYCEGDYEPEVRALIQALPLRDALCLDIGANIGLHAVSMARAVGAQGRVVAFEPEQRNYELLRNNIALSKLSNVTALNVAVGEASGVASMSINPDNFGDHRVSTAAGPNGSQEVKLVSLDELAIEGALPTNELRLIKIDVQGYETKVIRGMRKLLANAKEAAMIIEVMPEALRAAGSSAGELVSLLLELGYGGWEFSPDRVAPIQPPESYEMIAHGKYVDLVLSRDRRMLASAIGRVFPSFSVHLERLVVT